MRPATVDVLKAWAVYFLLKCAVVILAMHIGEHLGFLVVSFEEGPGLQEGVEMAWAVLAVYYFAVAVVAAFLFKWAVSTVRTRWRRRSALALVAVAAAAAAAATTSWAVA